MFILDLFAVLCCPTGRVRQTDRQAGRQTDRHRHRQTQTQTETDRHKHRQKQRQRQTDC